MYFSEYWMTTFKCNLPGQDAIYTEDCDTSNQRLNGNDLDPMVPYVIRATMALLFGIERARVKKCGSSGLCVAFINHADLWRDIHDHTSRLNISDLVYFDPTSGMPVSTKYSLYNYRAQSASCPSHCFVKVSSRGL